MKQNGRIKPKGFPKGLEIGGNTVHVWHGHFDVAHQYLENFRASLSAEEKEKVQKYKFEIDRDRSIISRGMLRTLLAGYLQTYPQALRFDYNEFGRPFLKSVPKSFPKAGGDFQFNLSHSHNRIIFAFVEDADIGVDVEFMKRDFNVTDLARHFFSHDEINSLLALPKKNRPAGFYRCWTRKEAFIKAKGSGLSFPLTSFSVSLDSDSAELLRTDWDASERKEWQLMTFRPSECYQAALAVRGRIDSVVERDWMEHFSEL